MSTLTTSSHIPSATSSQALGFGVTHFGSQDGQMIDLFGPVPVLANLSARQARQLGLMTSGICGLTSIGLSKSAADYPDIQWRKKAEHLRGQKWYRQKELSQETHSTYAE